MLTLYKNLCVYIYIYIYIYTHTYIYIYTHTFTHTLYMDAYMYIYIYMNVCIYICMNVCLDVLVKVHTAHILNNTLLILLKTCTKKSHKYLYSIDINKISHFLFHCLVTWSMKLTIIK